MKNKHCIIQNIFVDLSCQSLNFSLIKANFSDTIPTYHSFDGLRDYHANDGRPRGKVSVLLFIVCLRVLVFEFQHQFFFILYHIDVLYDVLNTTLFINTEVFKVTNQLVAVPTLLHNVR